VQFLEENAVVIDALCDVIARHGLRKRWRAFAIELELQTHVRYNPRAMKRSNKMLHPDISDVLARKAEGRSEFVGEWIRLHGWERGRRCNSNFKDGAIVDAYERIWYQEFPLCFESDIYAVLGGWHLPCADDDWYDLIEERLMVLTVRGSEPWVEAWRTRAGQFKVIQRIT
jgi:hypothetical protein